MNAGGKRRTRPLSRIIVAEPEEIPAVIGGFLLFFLLFASYFMLRPVRETFGIAGGVENIQWLFMGTFVATLAVVPVYGWISRTVARRALVPVTYGFSGMVMGGFAAALYLDPLNVWVARAFYIWLSVFNLFVISIAWSLMADLFRADQAHRLFGQIAAGASLGGLAGPLLSAGLVGTVGHAGLLLLSTALLLGTLVCVRFLLRWSGASAAVDQPAQRPVGGSVWAGLTLIARSPYLIGISGFVLLLASVSTFLYMEQARIVDATFPDPVRQTQVFGTIDAAVQSLTIGIQLFVTGRIAKRLGVGVLLGIVPLLMILGFGLLAVTATFPVLAGVVILRRVGEYALVRPGREMLFASLDPQAKYKAKNAIDTVVYRGGDMLSAWLNSAILLIGTASAAAVGGAALAGIWALLGFAIGRRHDRNTGAQHAGRVPAHSASAG